MGRKIAISQSVTTNIRISLKILNWLNYTARFFFIWVCKIELSPFVSKILINQDTYLAQGAGIPLGTKDKLIYNKNAFLEEKLD